jgi:hypothetical protein
VFEKLTQLKKFKASGELPIDLEESIEDTSKSTKKNRKIT